MRWWAKLLALMLVATGLLLASACAARPNLGTSITPSVSPSPLSTTSPAPVSLPSPGSAEQPATTFTLNLTVDPPGAGFIAAIPPFGPYSPGSTVTVSVIPPRVPPYIFSHWSGDVSGSDRSITFDMDSNKQVIARFVNPAITPSPPSRE